MSSPRDAVTPPGQDQISAADEPNPQLPPPAPPPVPPDHFTEADIEGDFVNVAPANLWLPQNGVDRQGIDRGTPTSRHRHWSASAEIPPVAPSHSRFDNWPPATRFSSAALAPQRPGTASPAQTEPSAPASTRSSPPPVSPHTHQHSDLLQSSPVQGLFDLTYVNDEILNDDNGDDDDGQVGGDNLVADNLVADNVVTDNLVADNLAADNLVAGNLYFSQIITPPTHQGGGTMSQDENNPRALAAKEVLNLDVDAKASIDIAVANDVIPNPPPWFFPQHVSFFPDKSLLYIGLFENHSDIFRAAPHKWRSLTDAHIRLLQMFVSILELYVITPVTPSMAGDITAKLHDLVFSNNWCRNLLAARQRIMERMKLECSNRNDSPWSRSQKQPPAAGEALGEKDWTVQRLGTSIVWTAHEQEIFSSNNLDKLYEPLALRVQELSTALVTMSRTASIPPPAPAPTAAAAGGTSDQISMGFARQQAMSQVKMTFSKVGKNTPLKEFEMFRLKADDYVRASAWNILPVAVQHQQIATLFTSDFWLAICQRHEFLNMPENRPRTSRPIEEHDVFLRWADYTHTSGEVVPGARTIATQVWNKLNSVSDDLTVIQDWVSGFVTPMATGRIQIKDMAQLISTYNAAKELYKRLPAPSVLGKPNVIIPALIANAAPPDVAKEIRKQMKSAKGEEARLRHGADAVFNFPNNNPAEPPTSLRLPSWALLVDVHDKLEQEVREAKSSPGINAILPRTEKCLMADSVEQQGESLLFAGEKQSGNRDARHRSRPPSAGSSSRRRDRTPSAIRPRRASSHSRSGSRPGTPAGPRIHPSWLQGWCSRCKSKQHTQRECQRNRDEFNCEGPGSCGGMGHEVSYCFKRMLKDNPNLAQPKPGTQAQPNQQTRSHGERQYYAEDRRSRLDNFQQQPAVQATPPRAASAHQQDVLYYHNDAQAAPPPSLPVPTTPAAGWQAHNPHFQQQQYFSPSPNSGPFSPGQQQQQQYDPQHSLPPPPPQPLSNRAHTPSRENTHEALYHMEDTSPVAGSNPVAGIPSITLKLWSQGKPMAKGSMVKVKAVTDTGCTTALASTSFARSAGLHIVPVSDEEAERHKVRMGDSEYVKPVGRR